MRVTLPARDTTANQSRQNAQMADARSLTVTKEIETRSDTSSSSPSLRFTNNNSLYVLKHTNCSCRFICHLCGNLSIDFALMKRPVHKCTLCHWLRKIAILSHEIINWYPCHPRELCTSLCHMPDQ